MLINLVTNLKSIKFGKDRHGGGNSNQPYIQTEIPTGIINSNPDFILRGGSLKRSKEDFERMTKFFIDTKSPNGFLFVAKQELLSRIAPKTQASGKIFNDGLYNPLSTLVQVGGVGLGLHFNKQTRQSTYIDVVKQDQTTKDNRLVQLSEGKLGNEVNILSYSGGPGSVLGLGKTNIKFSSQRTGKNNKFGKKIIDGTYQSGIKNSSTDKSNIIDFNILNVKGASFTYQNQIKGSDLFQINQKYNQEGGKSWNISVYDPMQKIGKTNIIKTEQNNTNVLTQEEINNSAELNIGRNTKSFSPKIQDFRTKLRIKTTINPDYRSQNIENRLGLGNPGIKFGRKKLKNLKSYTAGTGDGPVDLINALSLYQSSQVKEKDTSDAIKFRIQTINYDGQNPTFIHFRAFLNPISDSYNADWANRKYIGRGENMYNYNGFNRSISLSWVIAAQSREELLPLYRKLNYLVSNLAPDYSEQGYMRGPLIKLTVGDYISAVPGFINSMTVDIQDDATWEIAIDDNGDKDPTIRELPHIIRVNNFNFTPIHNFIPSKQNITVDKDGFVNEYKREKFIMNDE